MPSHVEENGWGIATGQWVGDGNGRCDSRFTGEVSYADVKFCF